MNKLTKEIKQNWLDALKSGKYIKGRGILIETDKEGIIRHCCLGVFACVLNLPVKDGVRIDDDNEDGYKAFEDYVGDYIEVGRLYRANDNSKFDDYRDPIAIIETLPTID